MIRILKSHVFLCVLTAAIFLFSKNAYSSIKGYTWSPALCDVCDESDELEGSSQKGVYSGNAETHVIKGHFYTGGKPPVRVEDIQDSVTIPSVEADPGSIFQVMDTVIQATSTSATTNPIAVSAESGASVILNNTKINTDGQRVAISSSSGSKIAMTGGSIKAVDSGTLFVSEISSVSLNDVNITSSRKNAVDGKNPDEVSDIVFDMSQGGDLDLNKVVVKAINSHGFRSGIFSNTFSVTKQFHVSNDDLYLNTVNVEDSTISVWGNKSYGIFFEDKAPNEKRESPFQQGNFKFNKTKIDVPDSTAIYTNAKGYPAFFFLTDTNISGNLLLQADNGAIAKVIAEGSSLTGGVRVHDKGSINFYLSNGSKWTLTTKKQKDSQDTGWGIDSYNSSISFVHLADSDIVFDQPECGGYQTLKIESKELNDGYIAEGKAQIYFNTYLNDGGALVNQETDRLLIHGNVSGSTTVHILPVKGSPWWSTGEGRNDQGISIIQVSGNAKQDSFKLYGGYVALNNSPYQYQLYAYGPGSTLGKAHTDQRLVKGTEDFWDFRLESRYIQSSISSNHDLISYDSNLESSHNELDLTLYDPVTKFESLDSYILPVSNLVDKDSGDSSNLSPTSTGFELETKFSSVHSEIISDLVGSKFEVKAPDCSAESHLNAGFELESEVSDVGSYISSFPVISEEEPEISSAIISSDSVTELESLDSHILPVSNLVDKDSGDSSNLSPTSTGFELETKFSSVHSETTSDLVGSKFEVKAPDCSAESHLNAGSELESEVSDSQTNFISTSSELAEKVSYASSNLSALDFYSKSDVHIEPRVRAVVPQVSTYLLLPNALFHTGLMEVITQNKRLEAMRTAFYSFLRSDTDPVFFTRAYSGNYHYASNLSAFEYGYCADLSYNALEAGVLLKTVESKYGSASFGVMGNYGRLSLEPLDVEDSQQSTFEKWLVTTYASVQNDKGIYVDGLLSYGLFNGDVSTIARGKTASLKGHPLSVSVTAGHTLITQDKGFVFDPHVQLVYQRLLFDVARDVDGFDVEIGKPDRWIMLFGGRLTKSLTTVENAHVTSFYGKLHFVRVFEDKQFVHFKDAFQLGETGSSLEVGLGFNAQLASNVELHSDLAYQHKLTKSGFSGTSVSGGLRYYF